MCERQGLQPLQSDPERAGTWTQVTQQKLAIRCLLWPSSRLVLQPWVSDSWINQGVATAPWWVPPVRKKGPSLAAMGGWEPSRRPRASCSSPSHCHFSLKPFHSASPGQGSVNTHQLTSLSATQCRAGQRVVPPSTQDGLLPSPTS